jgi:hypothetical protein
MAASQPVLPVQSTKTNHGSARKVDPKMSAVREQRTLRNQLPAPKPKSHNGASNSAKLTNGAFRFAIGYARRAPIHNTESIAAYKITARMD